MADPKWSDIGMFWATLGVGVITAAATAINYLLFKSQVDPEVIVFVEINETSAPLMNLVVQNIGKGVAMNIGFFASEPLPIVLGPKVGPQAQPLLANGIRSLPPGGKRVYLWGHFDDLTKAIEGRSIKVTATFDTDGKAPWDSGQRTTESILEVSSFAGTALPRNHEADAAEALANIAALTQSLSLGEALHVQVADAPPKTTAAEIEAPTERPAS
jgi:hypothetical protein